MHFILLSLACSVLVSVLLKLAPRRGLDVAQMVTWNYLATSLLAAWILRPSLEALRQPGAPWPELLVLAFVLPTLFLVLAKGTTVLFDFVENIWSKYISSHNSQVRWCFVNWWFFNKFINLIDILFDFNSFNYTVSFYFFLRYPFKRNS